MAFQTVPQSVKIVHGRMSEDFIGGPFAVFYIRDGKIGASVTGIRTAAACDARASEYSRAYAAPIVTPNVSLLAA